MSVTVEVYRSAGDRPGDEIREALIGESLEAALARGRAALDTEAHGWERVNVETEHDLRYRLGELVEVDDPLQGVPWHGAIVGIAHRFSGGAAVTTLDVRRPL